METEVRTLKQELANTQDALKAATKRCRDLVRELDNRAAGHESERALRDQQLSRILRALLVLEARLKQEQKSIRQLLCEKDNVIRNQQLEIARLRRYTKNYIKSKREQNHAKVDGQDDAAPNTDHSSFESSSSLLQVDSSQKSGLSKDIEKLKREIITKLKHADSPVVVVFEDVDRGIKKTHSFAGSDISKASLTSSENTDASIITTTTEGSPSLLSTEGFCEGESTDVSPGSTLNKSSSRCTPTTVTDSENETTMIVDDEEDDEENASFKFHENDDDDDDIRNSKKKSREGRGKISKAVKDSSRIGFTSITRSESKDDGMDCNFISEDEEKEPEPIYVNACNDNNSRNVKQAEIASTFAVKTREEYGVDNNNTTPRIEIDEQQNVEDTSGNWYSDPDEDRLNDDVFRHSVYRPNSKHNSVLECVNQILLQDMEEEENILSVPRRFKHRGRIVRFQPARLSDIESVGSEMERRNSEEGTLEKETTNSGNGSSEETGNFEGTASEDEFGMRIGERASSETKDSSQEESNLEEDTGTQKAIPLVIIEPKLELEEARNTAIVLSPCLANRTKTMQPSTNSSPPLKLERMEEKTCLQMSTKGLTIAKNLDYEDIESLPEVTSPPPKTPPALPPKPQFRNNTLILKKIPSPSFLIDETRKKLQLLDAGASEQGKKILGLLSSPLKSSSSTSSSNNTSRSFNLDDSFTKSNNDEGNFWRNRFNNVRSSFQTRQSNEVPGEQIRKGTPRVTNIVRQFEEFKIGGAGGGGVENEDTSKDRGKMKEKHLQIEFEQEFDIRQNFEEFNLDECDLSDDPDRPEGDGSERLGNLGSALGQVENANVLNDNNNSSTGYDHFLEATGLSNKSILTPSRLLSNHKSMLKPKDVKYKNRIKATAVLEKHGISAIGTTHVKHWTGPFV